MYILEGLNSNGKLITYCFTRSLQLTIDQSADRLAKEKGIYGIYSHYKAN